MTTLGEALDEYRKYGPSALSQQEVADALRLKLGTVIAADSCSQTDDRAKLLRSLDVTLFQVQDHKTDLDPALVAYVDDKFRQLQAVLTQRGDTAAKIIDAALAEPWEILDDLKSRVAQLEQVIPAAYLESVGDHIDKIVDAAVNDMEHIKQSACDANASMSTFLSDAQRAAQDAVLRHEFDHHSPRLPVVERVMERVRTWLAQPTVWQ